MGDTVARVRELEQIRNFLTGQALTSILDLFFSFIFNCGDVVLQLLVDAGRIDFFTLLCHLVRYN